MRIFDSIAPRVVEQSAIAAKFRAEMDRMAEAENRLALYSDDYEDIIRERIKGQFCKENYDRLRLSINGSQNILKRVVNEISMVYKDEASRTLSVKSDRYDAIKAELDIDTRMRRVNRLVNLLNDVLVRVAVRGGKIVYDIITPDIATVIQDDNDPGRAVAVTWARSLVNTQGQADTEYEYMDDLGWWCVLDKNFMVKETFFDPNTTPYRTPDGLPFMPLVPIHRAHPETAFWDQDTGRDLYSGTVQIGLNMTLLDYYFKTASFKQIYVIGADPSGLGNQIGDPQTIYNVPAPDPQSKPEIGTLDLQPHMQDLINALVYQINSVINAYGISADAWTLSVGEMSGRALKIKNRALLERRAEQIGTYSQAERDLFAATRIVNNAHASYMGWEKIPENAELETDFAEIEFPDDPLVERDILDRDLKRGVLSLGQYYMKFNPDVKDEKEAQAKAVKNLEETRKAIEAHPTLDAALNDILGGGGEEEGDEGKAGQEGGF